jgi:hypothetical protein
MATGGKTGRREKGRFQVPGSTLRAKNPSTSSGQAKIEVRKKGPFFAHRTLNFVLG